MIVCVVKSAVAWFLQSSNPAELIRLYLTFDLLGPATELATEYIAAVLGHGKEFFGLEVKQSSV